MIPPVRLSIVLSLLLCGSAFAADDIIVADFEGMIYGDWTTEGTAFGAGPAAGTLPGQMQVSGFAGHGLVNSFHGGDKATGKLTSPPFELERHYLTFLIGGGGWEGKTCMNLLIGGRVVRTATGPNTKPGGSESLQPDSWDVGEFVGQTAQIEIVDAATGGWGHINVDQIVLTDQKPKVMLAHPARDLVAERSLLSFPVKGDGIMRKVSVAVEGKIERTFDIELADGSPDWWAPLDISGWKGRKLTVQVDKLPDDSQALTQLLQSDTLPHAEDLYHEALRPQFHFSPQRGWNNDPNGLVFYQGQYHLFFQHNPYGTTWGNMHWGHAVSPDLIHWRELAETLYPDEFGPMFSGSAVIDAKNTSGLGSTESPPMVLIYTAAGNPTVQCLASSTDGGKTFAKYLGNPVVPQITGGNRDPKVYWNDETQKWVMSLFVGFPTDQKDKAGHTIQRGTIHFLSSPNLKAWKDESEIEGFYECPDYFQLPVDGDPKNKKWVLTAASSDYMVGAFDGVKFTPETPKLKGHLGRGFYAAQTYAGIPAEDGRRIQIGWLQAGSPGMPFNQAMSIPLELTLHATAEGPRLRWQPVRELAALRANTHAIGSVDLPPGGPNPLAGIDGELVELRVELESAGATETTFDIRGVSVAYNFQKQEISVNGSRAKAPLVDGKQRLIVYLDRTSVEIFASDGLAYVPFPVIPKAENRTLAISTLGGSVKLNDLAVYELKSAWNP